MVHNAWPSFFKRPCDLRSGFRIVSSANEDTGRTADLDEPNAGSEKNVQHRSAHASLRPPSAAFHVGQGLALDPSTFSQFLLIPTKKCPSGSDQPAINHIAG